MSPRSKVQNAALKDVRREAILSAALRVFTRHGLYGVTMANIAREAGVSYGLAYHYFKSKEDLFVELVHAAYEASQSIFLQAKNAPGSPMDRLRRLIEGSLAGGVKGVGAAYFRMVLQAVSLERVPAAISALNDDYLPRYFAVLEEIVRGRQKSKTFASADMKGAITAFIAMILGLPVVLERRKDAAIPAVDTIMRLFGSPGRS
jgi:AcrR family transcriptional regulator